MYAFRILCSSLDEPIASNTMLSTKLPESTPRALFSAFEQQVQEWLVDSPRISCRCTQLLVYAATDQS